MPSALYRTDVRATMGARAAPADDMPPGSKETRSTGGHAMAQPLAGHDIDAPLLSLVIPAFNERARLPRTLRILRRYLHDQSYAVEVIVVDDGSTDGTADLVARRASRW